MELIGYHSENQANSENYRKDYACCTPLLQESESKALKMLSDCVNCPHLANCDAHITHGVHKHLEGPNPCEFVIKPKSEKI